MTTPPTPPAAPTSFAEQELTLVRIVLQSRGWLITDAKITDTGITIIATKPATPQPLTLADLRNRA